MSRPNESEPMRKTWFSASPSSVVISPAWPGIRSRLAESNSVGSTVPSHGAAAASRTRSARTAPPMRTDQLARMFLIADPGIEEDVGNVDQQVDRHVDEREEQDQALHGREVAREHRVHGQPSEPGN